jgi:galactokinase
MPLPPPPPDPLARAAAAFRERFGVPPRWAASAPGRVNLIGEHVDYHAGLVLPIAIDRRCACVAAPAADATRSRVFAPDAEEGVLEFDARSDLRPLAVPGRWSAYVLGVVHFIRDLVRRAGVTPRNLDVAVASSVPLGAGLSSSASLEVSFATLLQDAWTFRVEGAELARRCQRAEHEFAGVPCGLMDQFVSALAHPGHALLIDCRDETARPVPMPDPAHAAVLVVDTRVRHALASSEYAARRRDGEAAARALGVTSLRDLAVVPDARSLGPAQLPLVRHVVTEIDRTRRAAAALRAGDLPAFGRLMNESHASLRDDYRVSCDELDGVVEAARAQPGVLGARMTGGGFGGCAVALVRPGAADAAADGIRAAFAARFGAPCTAFITHASEGARIDAVPQGPPAQ